MNITDIRIDGGKAFDWGKTSADYAKFRDIYPQEFYDRIVSLKLCINGQSVIGASLTEDEIAMWEPNFQFVKLN